MANLVDSAIQQLFKDGCKIVKLWENASPTSNFSAQKIPIVNLLDHRFLMVIGRLSTTNTYPAVSVADTKSTIAGELMRFINLRSESTTSSIYRSYAIEDTGISFSDCALKAGESGELITSNAYDIPVILYGIKLLGGGVIHKIKSLAASLFGRREVLVCQF